MTDPLMFRTTPLFAIPFFYILAAWFPSLPDQEPHRRWRLAQASAIIALGCSLISLLWLAVSGPAVMPGLTLATLGELGILTLSTRSDAAGDIVLLLVSFIGWVIVRYSQSYLSGDRYLLHSHAAIHPGGGQPDHYHQQFGHAGSGLAGRQSGAA